MVSVTLLQFTELTPLVDVAPFAGGVAVPPLIVAINGVPGANQRPRYRFVAAAVFPKTMYKGDHRPAGPIWLPCLIKQRQVPRPSKCALCLLHGSSFNEPVSPSACQPKAEVRIG